MESDTTMRDDAICLFLASFVERNVVSQPKTIPRNEILIPRPILGGGRAYWLIPLSIPQTSVCCLSFYYTHFVQIAALIRPDTNCSQRTPCSDVHPVTRALSGISLKTWRIWRVRFLQRRQVGETNEPRRSNLLMRPPPRSDT